MNLRHRAKLLTLSGVLALGALTGLAPMAANAACIPTTESCPVLPNVGGPGQVAHGSVSNELTPGATVRIEALPLDLSHVLATEYTTVDPCGRISLDSTVCNSGFYRMNVDNWVGPVQIMVDQTGIDGSFVAQPSVGPLATLSAFASGPSRGSPSGPLQCGVTAFGSGFGPIEQNVQVQVFDDLGNQQGPTQTVQADSTGKITLDSADAISFGYTGPGYVIATPSIVGQPVRTNLDLCRGSTAGQISAPGSTQIGSGSGTTSAGQSTTPGPSTGTGGAGTSGGGGLAPRVHAAE